MPSIKWQKEKMETISKCSYFDYMWFRYRSKLNHFEVLSWNWQSSKHKNKVWPFITWMMCKVLSQMCNAKFFSYNEVKAKEESFSKFELVIGFEWIYSLESFSMDKDSILLIHLEMTILLLVTNCTSSMESWT